MPTCGSTISGHLLALLMIRALSMLRLSLGKPSSSQARIVTSSPMTLASLKLALQGMPADLWAGQQFTWGRANVAVLSMRCQGSACVSCRCRHYDKADRAQKAAMALQRPMRCAAALSHLH